MNTKEQVYDVWAPAQSPWSPWVKPVLFTVIPLPPIENEPPAPPVDTGWAASADGTEALVLNLPGRDGITAALQLAALGYRPVPLYNAMPMPSVSSIAGPVPYVAVDVLGIARALQRGADRLAGLTLRNDAPPVFLLDHRRAGSGVSPPPDSFDNRSVCFTTDFPSGLHLRSRGIRSVLLVQPDYQLSDDLAHILRRWQEAGLVIRLLIPGPKAVPESLQVPKPSWFGFAFQRVLIALGLQAHPAGGFGGWVPDPSSGAG